MKATRRLALIAAGLSLVAGLTAAAHHSTAMFDQSKRLTLSGTVQKFQFTNPHTWLYVIVTDEQGKEVVWELEGGSTSHMVRKGWTFKSLKPGDKVKVEINPRVDGQTGGAFSAVTLSDGTVLGNTPGL